MDSDFRIIFGRQLRKEFRVSDRLPHTINAAIKALAGVPARESDNDNSSADGHREKKDQQLSSPIARPSSPSTSSK
jgi:hypothetical protein